jgi:hypothetical protein
VLKPRKLYRRFSKTIAGSSGTGLANIAPAGKPYGRWLSSCSLNCCTTSVPGLRVNTWSHASNRAFLDPCLIPSCYPSTESACTLCADTLAVPAGCQPSSLDDEESGLDPGTCCCLASSHIHFVNPPSPSTSTRHMGVYRQFYDARWCDSIFVLPLPARTLSTGCACWLSTSSCTPPVQSHAHCMRSVILFLSGL